MEEHNPSQLGHLTALFATTVKLSDFTMSSEGKVSVREGCHPFADLTRDTGAVSDQLKSKASTRAQAIIRDVLDRVGRRMLNPEGDKSRSVSRSREPDSDEELPSSKVPKPSPLSPPHLGESSEGWPALPTPGAKVALHARGHPSSGRQKGNPTQEGITGDLQSSEGSPTKASQGGHQSTRGHHGSRGTCL